MEQVTDELTSKQQNALTALLEQPTIGKAATAAGVGRTTLHTWLRMPAFAEAYRRARADALDAATGRLQQAAAAAVDTLERLARNDTGFVPPSAQVAAARSILDYTFRATDIADIENMLDELERAEDA